MTTTGTYAFNPSAAETILQAYMQGPGIRRTELGDHHFEDAGYAANMLAVDFSNRQPNRWQMATTPIALVAGTATYALDPQILAVSVVWLDQTDNGGNVISRVLGPLSAADYASLPFKEQPGQPSSYFFSLTIPPSITIWPVYNGSPTYALRIQTFRQVQDVSLTRGTTLDVPYRFLDAWTTGLAWRLCDYYPPADAVKVTRLEAQFEKRFQIAAALDQERVPLRVQPQLSSYYR